MFTYKIHFRKAEEFETFGCSQRLKLEGGYGRGAGEEKVLHRGLSCQCKNTKCLPDLAQRLFVCLDHPVRLAVGS